jgi:signal transduction histidine kinase
VSEQADNPEKRKVRLEALYKASVVNLPKINDLINLTLDGSREITVTPKKAGVVEILESAIKTNEALGQTKKVKIEIQGKASDLVVPHDPMQMERVFTNLIKNAIESCAETEKGREVLISARKDVRAQSLIISVDDAGQGLPLEPQSVFRLLKSTKLHGSGLGLIVSRKIVEANGGKLVPSHSPLLGGARFEVFLPC